MHKIHCLRICLLSFTVHLTRSSSQQTTITDSARCWSANTEYQLRSVDANGTFKEQTIKEIDLIRQCHLAFVQNITSPQSTSGSMERLKSQSPLTLGLEYGYGFLAVFIVSVLSLAGFVAFPIMKKPYYKYINAFFVALAVGTLYADTAFELFPVIVEFQMRPTNQRNDDGDHPNKKKPRIPLMLWQMTALVLTSYVFFTIELVIHFVIHRSRKQNSYDLSTHASQASDMHLSSIETIPKHHSFEHFHSHTGTTPSKKSTGWMIIIGDGIHNIADGLAIGAAFAENTLFGVTTAIAIACHELPTELGEYMVLIESGFTYRRALLFNFVSACTAILGFFIGASVAEDESARIWIFVVTAGTFTYIALVDLWPTLMPEHERFNWIRFICVTFGYLLGVSIMFILTIFEDDIVKRDNQ